jgi:hypothetical protein
MEMKIFLKTSGEECWSSQFNIHSLGEIIVQGGRNEAEFWIDSDYASSYDVLLSDGARMDLREAFKLRRLITDCYNRDFFEPKTEEDKQRGFTVGDCPGGRDEDIAGEFDLI